MNNLHVLVCVTGQKTCERLILEGAEQARQLDATLSVVHVAKPGAGVLGSPEEGRALDYLYQIASAHGAEMTMIHSDDVIGTLAAHARKVGADMIVMGVSARGNWDLPRALELHLPGVSVHGVYTE